jgi:hypothetical protein
VKWRSRGLSLRAAPCLSPCLAWYPATKAVGTWEHPHPGDLSPSCAVLMVRKMLVFQGPSATGLGQSGPAPWRNEASGLSSGPWDSANLSSISSRPAPADLCRGPQSHPSPFQLEICLPAMEPCVTQEVP